MGKYVKKEKRRQDIERVHAPWEQFPALRIKSMRTCNALFKNCKKKGGV
jgi:hypothetical protein